MIYVFNKAVFPAPQGNQKAGINILYVTPYKLPLEPQAVGIAVNPAALKPKAEDPIEVCCNQVGDQVIVPVGVPNECPIAT
jgi:hypothetical protein